MIAKTNPDRRRRAAESRGRRAEWYAAWWLRLHGYRILENRFRCSAGEIDLIARRGRGIVFVEVKRRRDETEALLAVGVKSRRRIARAAEIWLARHPRLCTCDRRFDIIVVGARLLPRHFRSVFDIDGHSW